MHVIDQMNIQLLASESVLHTHTKVNHRGQDGQVSATSVFGCFYHPIYVSVPAAPGNWSLFNLAETGAAVEAEDCVWDVEVGEVV